MDMKIAGLLLAAGMIAGLAGCATGPSGRLDSKTADPGYFLSLRQKGQLIGTGLIEDEQGRWYDVWIVPGYVQPARRTGKYLRQTGSDFAEYVQGEKYHDLAEDTGDALEWAYHDCLTEFTIEGVPGAWGRYWSAANDRVHRKVFGWWLAYPWALMESTVDTSVRVPVGLAGTALGTVWGVAVVPGYYAVNSTAKATWHFGVDAVLLPSVAGAWTTIVAPPMAIVGQKPAPSRVDGFWVRQLDEQNVHPIPTAETQLTPKDAEALSRWGTLLLTASQPYEDQRQALREQTQAEHVAIERKSTQMNADIGNREDGAVRAIVDDPSQQETLDYLRSRGFDSRRISRAEGEIRRYLGNQRKLPPEEINRLLQGANAEL